MQKIIIASLAALAAAVAPTSAFAWGQTGHRIIGEIAQDRINGLTAAQVELILGAEDLAEASTYADEQRSNPAPFWQEEAGPYHYVTIPEGQHYHEAGAPDEGDALSALQRFTATVRDPNATREEKALALRFIVHIVGDVHQPLHAGNGSDRGANDFRVEWFGEETNLHSVWDGRMIDSQSLSYLEYAERLDRRIEPEQTISWWDANPQVWVTESAALRDTIYPEAGEGEVPRIGYRYLFDHRDAMEQRLQQGGVRLAAYLDWIFAR